ncbi:VOC family protein [Chryseolinea soli]|uniref:Glyoxalase n=1 Tax=Chryseolinea soli TaxID=2321403 RepID=A0A385T0C4_9BACT|nr:VOC family protein [Chryseolinea soli]AYB35550.1 glyoxalase [Chryseolinea soli]
MFIKIMYFVQFVSDQDKALDFYTKLGFEKRVDYPGPEGRFLTLGYQGQDVEIMLWKGAAMPGTSKDLNLGSIFIESVDLRKDFEVLRSKGVKFLQPEPEDYAFGVRIAALDPDGNRIELRQRK